jgi:glycerol uptake facilitator-like aquaporin
MNPSVTLAFLSLGRISVADAMFYMLAQFVGGLRILA